MLVLTFPFQRLWHGMALAAGKNRSLAICTLTAKSFYTKRKSVMQCWPESIAKGAEFVMPTSK